MNMKRCLFLFLFLFVYSRAAAFRALKAQVKLKRARARVAKSWRPRKGLPHLFLDPLAPYSLLSSHKTSLQLDPLNAKLRQQATATLC
jgi:hypothetical protein